MAKKRKNGKIPPVDGGNWLKGKSEKRDEVENAIVFSFKDFISFYFGQIAGF